MATLTVTTPVNIDSLVGRTGGDTYAINGGFVTFDEDSRYGLNANTSATIGSLSPSATLGGSALVDGRAIWLIPFTGGGGTVPAFNTAITLGGATGKCIGVYSALNVAPATPGAAMPATGWIKVKQWNGTLYGTGALGGITATAAAGEKVGWLEIVGQEGSVCLVGSLNQIASGGYDGSLIKGDWYEVGTTTGNRATTYQIPTNGSLVWHGGVWVDKAVATAITGATWASGVLTVTSPAHGLSTDDRVMIDAILPRTFRTVDSVRCTVVNANTFTVPMATNPGSYSSGGTVAAQEWWPITDSVNTKVGATDYQGKHAWLDSTTGLLRFGNDGTTSTGGAVPASGLVIRLPNVMTANATSAAKTVNSFNTTLSQRYRYYNGNAGTIKVDHHSGTWSPSVFQTGKYVQMSDCAVVNQVSCASQASPCTFTNVCVGGNGNTATAQAFVVSAMSAAVSLIDCVISTGEMGGRFPLSVSSASNVTADRCRFTGTGGRTSATYCVNLNIGSNFTATRCQFGPHGGLATSSQYSNVTITNGSYFSSSYGLNPVATPTWLVVLTNLSQNWLVDTFTFYGPVPIPRSGFLSVASGSNNAVVRNMGTYASPIDNRLNGLQPWRSWSRSGTTVTVTENGHPYRVGDQVVVVNSSATAPVTLAVKTITAVATNTFDFTGVNTGATSGTMTYYVGGMSAVITSAGVEGLKVQNVHMRGNYGNPFSTSSTQTGMTLDNVSSDPFAYNLLPSFSANNLVARSIYETDYPIIAPQPAVFGTHFTDVFVREPGTAVPGQAAAVTGVSWTRSGTTCTVTSPNHGIVGNVQRIWVENSSAPTPVPNGWGASGVTLVPDDANTFHFTCINSGATSGTLDYRLAGDSQFRVLMMEQSDATIGQAVVTVAGVGGFSGSGTLPLPLAGDYATWEMPGYITGYEGFGLTPAIPYGMSLTSLANIQQLDIAYQRNDGSGWSGWRNAAFWRAGAGGASGSAQVTMTSTTGVNVGDYVMGTGIAAGAKVQSIDTATQITVTIANAAAVSGVLCFWWMPNETAFPSSGVKFRVRMTANVANVAAAYQIDFPLLSSNTSRARLYSQLTQYTLTFTGLQPGSDVRVLAAGTVTNLLNVDSVAGTTQAFTYYYVAGTQIDVQVLKDGYKPFRYQGYLLGAKNADFLVQQTVAIDEGP